MNRRGVVVVGHGAAAVHAVRGLREAGYDGDVHILSDGGETPYSPMLLGYYIGGGLSRDRCFPFGLGAALHRELGVVFHGGDPVRGLDARDRVVETVSGESYAYDACIVASGAVPVSLPVPGATGARVHHLRTLEQADRLQAALAAGVRRVMVVGASLVGMKLVEALVRRAVEVVLVDTAPQVLPGAAHLECAQMVAHGLQTHGVELHLGRAVRAFEETADGLRAELSERGAAEPGATAPRVSESVAPDTAAVASPPAGPVSVDVDLAVVAIGVSPNVDFVDRGQVAVDRGIVVDQQCASQVPGLWAAGDCAEMWNPLSGRHEVIGLWASACYQGRTAGRNVGRVLTGGLGQVPPPERAPAAFAAHVIHFLDWVFVGIGDPRAGGGSADTLEACDPDRDVFYRLVVEDGRVVAANLLNCCDGAGMLRSAATRGRVGDGPGGVLPLGWPRFVQETCGVQAAAAVLDAVGKGEGGV